MSARHGLGLTKWWKKFAHTSYLRTQQLSPFEQHAVSPMAKDAQKKFQQKIADNVFDSFPALAFGAGLLVWADAEYARSIRSHRD